MTTQYKIAWDTAIVCLIKGYPQEIWFAPIDDDKKQPLWDKAKKYVEKQRALNREPLLFGGTNE
jgi:hypothetical protein